MKLHFYYRISDEKLNPLSLYECLALKNLIEKNNLVVPNVQDKKEGQIKNTYLEVCELFQIFRVNYNILIIFII